VVTGVGRGSLRACEPSRGVWGNLAARHQRQNFKRGGGVVGKGTEKGGGPGGWHRVEVKGGGVWVDSGAAEASTVGRRVRQGSGEREVARCHVGPRHSTNVV
jgi:hypothetical protein